MTHLETLKRKLASEAWRKLDRPELLKHLRELGAPYEDMIFMAALRCQALWPMFDKTLCWSLDYKSEHNDFHRESSKQRYHAFCALRRYRSIQSEATKGVIDGAPSVGVIRNFLEVMHLDSPTVVLDTDIAPACTYYEEALKDTTPGAEIEPIIKASYPDWILERRVFHAQDSAEILKAFGDDFIRLLQNTADDLKSRITSTDEDTLKDVGMLMEQEEDNTQRIPFSPAMGILNNALGGGLGRKEHIVFVGPTGSGKTVMACQLAANMALQGNKVCYVTTEQPAIEIMPRMLSNLSSYGAEPGKIPFRLIKDGINKSILSPEQVKSLEYISGKLKGNLGIEEWLGSGLTASDLEATVRKFVTRYGSIDVLILDWIGGALASELDPDLKRSNYLDAATKMKDLAYSYNMATISMAQAVAGTEKVRYISDRHIAECKTLHREAVAGFGISALANVSENTETTYQNEQYLYAFKSRKAPGLAIDITRRFDYQTFVFSSKTTVVQ